MELSRIETLLVKYFEADTSTAEEQELQHYFSQENGATFGGISFYVCILFQSQRRAVYQAPSIKTFEKI